MHRLRHAALAAIVFAGALASTVAAAIDDRPAKQLFSAVSTPSPGALRALGSYARGCLAGAVALPPEGTRWQAMRLSRNRNWGTPLLVSYIEKLANDAARDGWNGVLVGDMSQPRGGPMATGHASHQTGLDVDIWYIPMPAGGLSREHRETLSAPSVLVDGRLEVDPARWTPAPAALLKRAASYPEVARIFVSPAIKKAMCDATAGDRSFLQKLRPWFGHDDHFHVRLSCPPGMVSCADQEPPPGSDGCGAELASWFRPAPPPVPPGPPFRLPPEVTLADLPPACTGVLTSGPGGLGPAELKVPVPLPALRPAER